MTEPALFEIVYWHWFVLAAILGTLEILTPGIFFLWLAIAAALTGGIAFLIPGTGEVFQLISFSVLSMVLVFVAWKYLKKQPMTSDQPLLNNRMAQYVGRHYTLETAIENGTGRIKLGDSTWKVEGPDMPEGSQVTIIGYDGAVLKVEKSS